MEKKRIVITGASGQLGMELQALWRGKEDADYVFLNRADLDLSDVRSIAGKLRKLRPDYILHAAAYTAVDRAEDEPHVADRINHLATKKIAKYCGQHGVKLLYISTDYVFSGEKNSPLKEQDQPSPINIYGKTKLLGELAALKNNKETIVLRTSWLYSRYGKNFVKTMLKLQQERPKVSVVNDQFGSPTFAQDLALAIQAILLGEIWEPGVYHYGDAGKASWFEFALAIQQYAGVSCEVEPVVSELFPTVAQRPRYTVLDTTKISDTYGLVIPDWRESLKRMIGMLESQPGLETKQI